MTVGRRLDELDNAAKWLVALDVQILTSTDQKVVDKDQFSAMAYFTRKGVANLDC